MEASLLWLAACGWAVDLFLFAFIGACIVGSSEIQDVRLVRPTVVYSRTNFAENQEGEDGLRDML